MQLLTKGKQLIDMATLLLQAGEGWEARSHVLAGRLTVPEPLGLRHRSPGEWIGGSARHHTKTQLRETGVTDRRRRNINVFSRGTNARVGRCYRSG